MVNILKNITNINKTVLSGKVNKYITIHYTGNETDKAASNANYFKAVKRGASAHYFVDENNIYQVVEDKDAAWHVGVNYGKNNLFGKCTNRNSIGIEMCSTNGKIADKTFANTVELTKFLMKKYGIPAGNVVRHYDVCSKSCPGWKGWLPNDESLWKKFKSQLGEEKIITVTEAKEKKKAAAEAATYKVKVTDSCLNIRSGPSANTSIVSKIIDKGTYTIVETQGNWGLLKTYKTKRNGWINLKYTKKL